MRSLFLVIIYLSLGTHIVYSQETFSGPFKSWANVKTKFGAKGDGKSDDTKSLQKAIDGLTVSTMNFNTGSNAYTTIYLPAGVYCISSTLLLKGKVGVSIVGEDPKNTIIRWIGAAEDTMFWANGSAYFKVARITWDAASKSGIKCVSIQWKDKWNDGKTRSFASLNIEVSDCVFTGNPEYGIVGGTYGGKGEDGTGSNDSEVLIRRCRFYGCQRGVVIRGFNALDYWIWDCSFRDCGIALYCKHGNYHLYNSHFFSSTKSDIVNVGGFYCSVRNCYSSNSNQFSVDSFNLCSAFKRIFRGNVVVGVKKTAIYYRHFGNLELSDNFIQMAKPDKATPAVYYSSGGGCGTDKILSISNNFGMAESHNSEVRKQIRDVGDKKNLLKSATLPLAPTIDSLPGTPVLDNAKVFDVPVGANADAIQKILDAASSLGTQKAIVHFPVGNYSIDKPLLVKGGSNMQILGDGFIYSSVLRKQKGAFPETPLLTVKGPSAIVIKDIVFSDNDNPASKVPVILFQNIDQQGSQAHIDQLYSLCPNTMYLDKLDYLYLEKTNSFFSDGTYIDAGTLVQSGKGTHKVVFNGGQFVGSVLKNNATLIARDCWWEGMEHTPIKLEGEGNYLVDGAMVAPRSMDSGTTITVGKFTGNVVFENMYLVGGIDVKTDNPKLNLMLWNVNFQYMNNPLRFIRSGIKYKMWTSGLTYQCFNNESIGCRGDAVEVSDQKFNISDENAYVLEMSKMSRSRLTVPYTNLSAGISNFYLSRVAIESQGLGIKICK